MKHFEIFDSTLREGMQTPGGIGGSDKERVYAANIIAQYADWIELGMPANAVDFVRMTKIVESFETNKRDIGIAALCLLSTHDVDKSWQVMGKYHKTMPHVFIGLSEEHRQQRKKDWTPKDYEQTITEVMAHASSYPFSRVMFSPEDSFRTFANTPELFFRFAEAAIKGHSKGRKQSGIKDVPILNFPDTVGYSSISEFEEMLDQIHEHFGTSIDISLHDHNDTGSSLQRAVESLKNGKANIIQTTFGQLGERNGIAQLEALLAVLDERGMLEGKHYADPERLSQLVPAAYAVAAALGRTIPVEAPVSGKRCAVSTAGIHTQIAMRSSATYHIFGDRYGAKPIIEFGPTSGAHQIMPMLKELGIYREKSDPTVQKFVDQLKEQCNLEKRSLTESDAIYQAIHYFTDNVDPLVITDYKVPLERNAKESSVQIWGTYKGNTIEGVMGTGKGVVEALLDVLDTVVNPEGTKHLQLEGFDPRVIPKIAQQYLEWDIGAFPQLPKGLDVHSDFQLVTAVKNTAAQNGNGVYHGFAREEDTFRTIMDSCIDAVQKMVAIETYMAQQR